MVNRYLGAFNRTTWSRIIVLMMIVLCSIPAYAQKKTGKSEKKAKREAAAKKKEKDRRDRTAKRDAEQRKKQNAKQAEKNRLKREEKAAKTDTFKLVKILIAKKKFHKADRILARYNRAHKNNLNGNWVQSQVNLYRGNFKRSKKQYDTTLKNNPTNDYLRLDYIHSLADMGRTAEAEAMLNNMENGGSDYTDIARLRTRIYYYDGDLKRSLAYLHRSMMQDASNKDANDLHDLIEMMRAPRVSLNTYYLSDNQPLKVFGPSVKFDKYFSKFFALNVTATDLHFMQDKTSDAPWVSVSNRMSFPRSGTRIGYGVGVMRFPSDNSTQLTGELNISQRLSQHFDVEVGVDRVPYFGTKASVDTTITATRFNASLSFHQNNWQAQAAFLNSRYPDENNVYSAYAWFLAPVAVFPQGRFQLGLSCSYSNSNENRYVPVNSLSSILTNYSPDMTIAGEYNPYFTPGSQYITAALLSFNVNLSSRVALYINGDLGYGTINNPYFFLNKDQAGNVTIEKGYSNESFTPYSASAALNYHISKTWLLNAKYTYRSTYFFNSNYLGLGIEKSFWHNDKKDRKTNDKRSSFSNRVKAIEDKLANLYHCKNSSELKQSVDNIKKETVALRDELQKRRNTREIANGSEEADKIDDRISNLNEMISEIDDVKMNDDKEPGTNQRDWLVDRQYQLSTIHYSGNLDDDK